MKRDSTLYTIGFAAVVCLICGIAVASSAVGLQDRQQENKTVDRMAKVLEASGLLPEQKLSAEEIAELFEARVRPKTFELKTGMPSKVDAASYDMHAAMKDPETSSKATENAAKVQRLPTVGLLYEIVGDDRETTTTLVLPVEGKGLWSTLYGFLALDADAETVKGLIFYEHGETPGLGGEVDNPRWRDLWPGRKAFDATGQPALTVIKGRAGSVADDPHQVDGLSGATITSRGVTHLVQFWLGDDGWGPTLKHYRSLGKTAALDALPQRPQASQTPPSINTQQGTE